MTIPDEPDLETQLAWDVLIYGQCFTSTRQNGTRERIDPRHVVIGIDVIKTLDAKTAPDRESP